MKLRRILKDSGPTVQAQGQSGWVQLDRIEDLSTIGGVLGTTNNLSDDVLSVLALGPVGWSALAERVDQLESDDDGSTEPILPFAPASFRDFMLFEDHVIAASRGYARRFMPWSFPVTQAIEFITRKPMNVFRPHRLWYQQPIYYLSNHLNIVVSGTPITWPRYSSALDYELELGAVLAHPLHNATAEEAHRAIGGFVVLNDFSARDVQKEEMDSGFGPQKAKHFASSISSTIVTADEVLASIDQLNATVEINGHVVAQCRSEGMHHSLAEAIAFASQGEKLFPGELFGSGTFPGGTGIENGAWLRPEDDLRLTIDRVGSVQNMIREEAAP
ncbi:MAG: fumarylacetoacetate hydrolase family protein [Pseudomonadota bacterium]